MGEEVASLHDLAAPVGRAWVGLDARNAMPEVGGVGRLAHLAVADDVDAGLDLLGDHLVDRPGGLGLERRGVDELALFPVEHEVDQRMRPRQAAGMRGENALGAGFHARSRDFMLSVDLLSVAADRAGWFIRACHL